MANRHLSRSIVMQTLYEWDFNGGKESKLEEILERNINEFAPGLEDDKFVRDLMTKYPDAGIKLCIPSRE